MQWLSDLRKNHFLRVGLSSWLLAQGMKTLLYGAKTGKFEISRLLGDGGMPSGHSATVTSLAVASALKYGADSYAFALSAILAAVVCHDAMGVRLETGKQAAAINALMEQSTTGAKTKLKEFVGHTPAQVAAGMALGAVNAVVLSRRCAYFSPGT